VLFCVYVVGTWNGPKWDPNISNLMQVLISIQGLILGVEHPYFLEPGHGGWEGSVKAGDFSSTGHTLTGATVAEDIRLPIKAAIYEEKIFDGTIRYAMLEMLRAASSSTDTQTGLRYLDQFKLPISAHFYYNREAILREVKSRETREAIAPAGNESSLFLSAMSDGQADHTAAHEHISSSISKLRPALESILCSLEEPDLNATVASVAASAAALNIQTSDDNPFSGAGLHQKPSALLESEESTSDDPLNCLRRLIQEAAVSGHAAKASKLQAALQVEEKAIEVLQQSMKVAAAQGNYIRAGQLQEQLNARLASIEDLPNELENQSKPMKDLMSAGAKKKKLPGIMPPGGLLEQDSDSDEEDEDEDGEEVFDDDDVLGTGFPPSIAMPKKSFPPAGSQYRTADPRHLWGEGRTLKSESTKDQPVEVAVSDRQLPTAPRSGVLCRLRIRLPDSNMLTEDFDASDTITDIYRRIDPYFQVPSSTSGVATADGNIASKLKRTQVMTPYGPSMVQAPAFSEPLSIKGYTLIMSRPKRECEDVRNENTQGGGLVKWGDLESRFR
jgi:hypothetical protein